MSFRAKGKSAAVAPNEAAFPSGGIDATLARWMMDDGIRRDIAFVGTISHAIIGACG
jgi:hypothetical protein